MPLEGKDAVSITSLPDLHALIVAARGEHLTIARPGDTIYPVCMPCIGERWRATVRSIPNLYRLVLACGSNIVTIRRPRDRCDLFCMSSIDDFARASGRLEHLNKGIIAGRSDEFAIWRPGEGIDARQMPGKDNS